MLKRHISLIVVFLVASLLHGQDSLENKYSVRTVVIDAGHGGKDPGCHGAISNEKDVCLSIALKLGVYIKQSFPEVKVVYTRDTDVFIELHRRAEIANKADADLFISIHANAASPTAFGTETYVMGLKYQIKNLDISHENEVIFLEDNYEKNYELELNSPKAIIFRRLLQQEYLNNSIRLAEKIENQFEERVGRHSRGVRQKVLYVMYRTSCPSVLIETGFLTNKNEETFLNSEKGQVYLSSAMFRAFREYKLESEGLSKEEIAEFVKNGQLVSEDNEVDSITEIIDSVEIQKPNSVEVIIKDSLKETIIGNTFYSIQITSFTEKIDVNSPQFSDLTDVFEYHQGGMFKYASGKFPTHKSALEQQKLIREKGYKDAFIIAFRKDKRISVEEAKQKLKD